MTDNTSPRPWTVHKGDTTDIRAANGLLIASDEQYYPIFEGKNAALIVRAVNAYDRLQRENEAMREALTAVRDWLLTTGPMVDDGITHPLFVKANNAVNAALAAGEG